MTSRPSECGKRIKYRACQCGCRFYTVTTEKVISKYRISWAGENESRRLRILDSLAVDQAKINRSKWRGERAA